MATIADTIRNQIVTNLSSYQQFRVATELPFTASGETLFVKNKKTVYVDELQEEIVQLYRTLDQQEVMQKDQQVLAYMSTDAKNQPSDLDDVITAIKSARSAVSGSMEQETTVTSDIVDDVITYTFEFNIINL
tara:strand:- start:4421 stop:4819 length:399 start_codon:yes stop_codon:yes gene_type:complete